MMKHLNRPKSCGRLSQREYRQRSKSIEPRHQ